MSNYTYEECQITGTRAMTYEQFIDYVPNRKGNRSFKDPSFSNETRGYLSVASQKRIRRIIDTWMTALEVYHYIKGNKREAIKNDIRFLTLTLPAAQMHPDKVIKREALNPLIIWLNRSQKVSSYLWVAEKQKNGNLHFHILCNHWVNYMAVQKQWNKLLRGMGYIDEYRRNQLAFHANGFQPRYELADQWPLTNQYRAYCKGMAEDWQNPNSTDIHTLKKINNVASYLCKEMTKGSKGQTIEGKIYGNTDKLSQLKPFTMQCTWEVGKWLEMMAAKERATKVRTEHCSIYRGVLLPSMRKQLPKQYNELKKHYMGQLKIIGYSH